MERPSRIFILFYYFFFCRPQVKENSKQYVQFSEQLYRKQLLGAPEVSLVEENLLL